MNTIKNDKSHYSAALKQFAVKTFVTDYKLRWKAASVHQV
jgi:hypothetical protein